MSEPPPDGQEFELNLPQEQEDKICRENAERLFCSDFEGP
jgi:predicted TIM-barrel fold metal-dependent hydrolase